MNASVVAGAAVAIVILAQMLKKTNPEAATAVTVAAGALFFLSAAGALLPALLEIEHLLHSATAANEWIVLLLKSTGVCLLVQFAADCCRDAGESALAGRVEFAGKAAVVVMVLPMFREILKLVTELLK